ncbi:hypothetical protein JQX13_31795 [Archangium violaceum]|uniref:hypothetical protein n=1 Tax=Archangium violaceum TaxID=83451 RepID=UPI00193B6349|nr:hypothetical protein [Archangium violaceum]QRK04792.1 hypothetical protein JQX13_31795 [Archangium violaceum]
MKRWRWAALVAVGCWVGCGEGGSLPTQNQDPAAVTNPDGTVDIPDTPPGDGSGTPATLTNLWPLTQGSTWTYRIDDPKLGRFEKRVEVLGEQTVPETTMTAVAMRSTQPHLEEISWQLAKDGVVYRLREEDHKAGALARVTTWNPAAMKSLDQERPMGWNVESILNELTRYPNSSREDDTDKKKYTWSVEAVNDTVTTQAGTFANAIRLKRERKDKNEPARTYWLVPGVGKVKETGERTEELISYDVKKP